MPPPCPITAVVHDGTVHVSSDLPVPWWSFGKTVLASAALALVAQGRIPLDEALRNRPFTLRQLLQHTAGVRSYSSLSAYHAAVAAGKMPWPVEDMLRRSGADTLMHEPGQGWAYSNIGYLFVRELIEESLDAPLDVALERFVFGPLGIAGVTVAREPAELEATAWGNAQGYHPGWAYHGLLLGPARAAVLLMHRLLAGDLLPPELLAAMRDGRRVGGAVAGRPWRTANYGLGLMIGQGEPPNEYIGHTGEGPGSVSAVYRLAAPAGHQRTAAAFAPVNDQGMVEGRAMELASTG